MKRTDSWASLLQGVSQQIPEVRFPGQHTEQVNMIPDPVVGLARRPGSEWQAEHDLGLPSFDFDALVADTATWTSFDYNNSGKDYVVMYRKGARVSTDMPTMLVYDRTAKVLVPYARGVDAGLDTVEAGGISAITSSGQYVFFAGDLLVPTMSSTPRWDDAVNRGRAALWVRGGGYNRRYSVTLTQTNGVLRSFEYTTPNASYAGLLDTSAVPLYMADPAGGTSTDTEVLFVQLIGGAYLAELQWYAWTPTVLSARKAGVVMTNTHPAAPANSSQYKWVAGDKYITLHSSNANALDLAVTYTHTKVVTNPNYARQVGLLTTAYNTAVTEHIRTSAIAVEPENIAESLRLAAVAAGVTGSITRQGTHVFFDAVKAMTADDGGDDTLLRAVAQEVTTLDKVTSKHWVGKTVRVRAKNAEESFYLVATATDPAVLSGITEVTWVEGAGLEQNVTGGICLGTVHAGQFYAASTSAGLAALTGLDVPAFIPSSAGDDISNPSPFFVGGKITYLGVFQDRLLVGSGGVLRASRTADYLNFFRTSVLTAAADEAVEFLSEASESDELRHGVLYDQTLALFGKNKQYVIDGTVALGPTSARMPVMSAHADAADAAPVAAGGVIFYAKSAEGTASLHQIQPGQNQNSPESYPASSQLDDYLMGTCVDIRVQAKPSTLFMRTDGSRTNLFVFSYVDRQDGRKQDAWHRWVFDPELGAIIAMSPTPQGLLVFFLREANGKAFVVADLCQLSAQLSRRPYLDSQRRLSVVEGSSDGSVILASTGWQAALDDTDDNFLLGGTLEDVVSLQTEFPESAGNIWVGKAFDAYVVPTNPFVRDRNDVAITTGRLTIQQIIPTFNRSSGYFAEIVAGEEALVIENTGRIVGDPNNVVGREVVTSFNDIIGIGRESREFDLTIKSRTWLPFTITRMSWAGQFFKH